MDQQFAQLQGDMNKGGGSSFMIILLVLVVLAYVAVRMKMIPASVLTAIGIPASVLTEIGIPASGAGEAASGGAAGGGGDGGSSGAASQATPGGPVGGGTPPPVPYKKVTGSVQFNSASGEAGKADCTWLKEAKYPSAQQVAGTSCKVKVDPCKLLGTTLDAAPTCWTTDSLCSGGIVPSQSTGANPVCVIQQRGSGDPGPTNNLVSVNVPEGMTLDVNAGTSCGKTSVYSKQCGSDCIYTLPNPTSNLGFQFGLSPGFEMQCNGQTLKGPAPPSATGASSSS